MYSIARYESNITSKDAETQKRFEMVKRLSRNFTVENRTAMEIDKLLVEQFNIEESRAITPKTEPKPESKYPKSSSTNTFSEIEERFSELFEALKNRQAGNGNIDPKNLEKAIKEAVENVKIRFGDLHEDVQKMLFSQPQVVKYELPNVKTSAFKKPDIDSFQSIVDDVMLGNNVMLIGGAGTGKTYLAENLISKLAMGREHLTINCSQWTSPTEIIGGQTMDGYVEGKLIEAWKNGFVLILDELPKIDPNTAGLFNDALAKTKIPNAVIFNSRRESFVKHPDFACIATGNIYPDKESIAYGANNKQDLSLLDRFSGSVYFIEKNPTIEKQILQNDMIWSISDRIRSAIEELKYEAQLSLRFMINARDTYNLEMKRAEEAGKDKLKPNEGKTFRSAIDSYLSTFTEIQQKNIKSRIRYDEIFTDYEYRRFDKNKKVY